MPDANTNQNTVIMLDYLGAKYTYSIESCMSAKDFLEQIKQTADLPSNVLEPGETPGGKIFKGFVMGEHFSLKKKIFGMPGQYVRELQGKVSEIKTGNKSRTIVEVRFIDNPGVLVGKYAVYVGVGICGFVLVMMFLHFVVDTTMWLFVLGALAVIYLIYNAGRQAAFRHEEEVFDHVKKIAAGVVPNPDSILN
ncbi:hypothetical protein KA183_21080 [bacterium]|nr:hypothetical protein [bacterium]